MTNHVKHTTEWTDVQFAPKDGTIFLAKVSDWYLRKIRYALIRMASGGYWEEPSSHDQTFEDGDILAVHILEPLPSQD